MGFLETVKNGLQDITSLEVATLHGGDVPLDTAIDEASKKEIETKVKAQEDKVKAARTAWLNAEERSDRNRKRREYRQEKKELNRLNTELYAVSPNDIFSKIEIAMGKASTVGYTKYEFAGDSVNFQNSSIGEEQSYLREAHQKSVESALEVRQQLLDLAEKLMGKGQLT